MMAAAATTEAPSNRLRLTAMSEPGPISVGDTFSTVVIRVTDALSGEPVPGCPVDFICRDGILERLDDRDETDAQGVARATFRASDVGECAIECFACTALDGEAQDPASLTLRSTVLPAAPSAPRSYDALDQAMDAALLAAPPPAHEPQPLILPPPVEPEADGTYGTPAMRASVISQDHDAYRLPEHRGWFRTAIAALALTATAVLWLWTFSGVFGAPDGYACSGQVKDGQLVYSCVPK